MVKKIISYVVGGIGVLGLLVTSIPKAWDVIPIPENLIKILSQINVTIVSIGLIIASLIFLKNAGKSKKVVEKEVPIYKEKDVVGFRRIKGK